MADIDELKMEVSIFLIFLLNLHCLIVFDETPATRLYWSSSNTKRDPQKGPNKQTDLIVFKITAI